MLKTIHFSTQNESSDGHIVSNQYVLADWLKVNHKIKIQIRSPASADHSLPRLGLSWRLQYTHPFANNRTADTSSTHLPDWSLYRKHSKIVIWVLKAPYPEGGNILSKSALYDFSISPCWPEGVHFHTEHEAWLGHLFSIQIFITNLLCVKDSSRWWVPKASKVPVSWNLQVNK